MGLVTLERRLSMLHVATILLFDTILFLVLGNYLERSNNVEDILIHFSLKTRRQVFVLFPWFGILLWLAELARKLYWNNRRLYYACQWLLNGTGLVLMILGVLKPDDGVSSWGFLLCLWMWIADVLVHHYPHGGSGKQDNPRPRPDDPTPTGDTADAWLKELSRQPTYR